MNQQLRRAAIPALLSLALLSGGAFAQTSSSSSQSTMATSKNPSPQSRADRVEEKISEWHTQLAITPAQSAQWDAYAQVIRSNASKARDAFKQRADALPQMNADDTMKSYAQLAQMNADNMKTLSASFSALYAVLSPTQKQTADELFKSGHVPGTPPAHKPRKSSEPAHATSSAG